MLIRSRRPSDESGFTLIEMAFVVLLVSIIVAAAMGALISLQNAESHNDALIQEEQAASRVMAQMERDIRSASTIAIPTGAAAADQLQVGILAAGGSSTQVQWVFDPSAGTLTRERQVGGSFQATGDVIKGVSNGAAIPVFTYYDSTAYDISARTTSDIAACATAVGIHVRISSSRAVGSFEETAQVALTNQVLQLTAPGDGWCGSA